VKRRTKALVEVAFAIMETPDERLWGYDLSKRSGVRSGVLYPMLARMLDDGWLTDGWEDPTNIAEKRPPRRYYELTDLGRLELAALQRVRESSRVRPLHWGLADG
jgi:PadR family transcriptional regulator, regulatory protein PadR